MGVRLLGAHYPETTLSTGLPDQGVVGPALCGQQPVAGHPVHAGLSIALHRPHLLQVRGRGLGPQNLQEVEGALPGLSTTSGPTLPCPEFSAGYWRLAVLMRLSLGLSSMATGSMGWIGHPWCCSRTGWRIEDQVWLCFTCGHLRAQGLLLRGHFYFC